MDYEALNDKQLISLLFTEEDRLPRDAADEFVKRGELMVGPLAEIVSKRYAWQKDSPDWWAVVHAAFILGAIGTKATVLPLLKSLRYASAHDCDWVITDLPSMFGRIGLDAVEGLKMIALDRTSDWFERAHAIDGLAAVTLSTPEIKEEVFKFIGAIFCDGTEERDVRDSAAHVLLDFREAEYRDALLAFGAEEEALKEKELYYAAAFDRKDVVEAFSRGEKELEHYTRNWLDFYDEEEIRKRQRRWEKEKKELREEEVRDRGELVHAGSQFMHQEPKIGRNEPCPCGSGKKFKKCCGMEH